MLGTERICSTVPIAIDDLDGDHKDDLILLDEGKQLITIIQNGDLNKSIVDRGDYVSFGGDWAIVTGDLDNDGIPELLSSGIEDGTNVLKRNNGNYAITQTTIDIFSQNSNLVDINNDGSLDFFVCNDVGKNLFYVNDGNGKLIQEDFIDFKTSEEDDMSGNYSSIFFDANQDGHTDLYIGKCSAGVNDPTDPRRVNTLYINNGDYSFTERGEDYGLNIGNQTWSVDAGDIDNDGDADIFLANHGVPHDLMINNGDGTYTRFDALPAGSKSFAYQCFFADFDNNGWLDIFVSSPDNSYILYNESMCFSLSTLTHNGSQPFSGVTGDLNDDGFLDLYLGFAQSFQEPSSKSDVVLINDGNSNNYIDISLEGTESNRDGIGANVFVYYDGRQQYREVIAGKSYGIMNTTNNHFGLGQHTSIDSIIVQWPSGNESQIYNDIQVNSKMHIVERGCVIRDLFIPDYQLCNNEPIEVTLIGYDEYRWSTGEYTSSITIGDEGSYRLIAVKDGCEFVSNFFNVEVEQLYHPDEIILAESRVGCNDEIIRLEAPSGHDYQWSTGESTRAITIDEEGEYNVVFSTNCATYESSIKRIDWIDVETETIRDSIFKDESAQVVILGDDVAWYQNKNDLFPISKENVFEFGPLQRDTFLFAGYREAGSLFSENILSQVPLNEELPNDFPNDSLQFTVYDEISFRSFQVRTQDPGKRRIELFKEGQLFFTKEVELGNGINTIALNLELQSGNYYLTTNVDVNVSEFGSNHPKLSTQEFLPFDRAISTYLNIEGGTSNSNKIPYFFNWKIDHGLYDCEERYEVHVTVKNTVNTEYIKKGRLQVIPNVLQPSQVFKIDVPVGGIIEGIAVFSESSQLIDQLNGHQIIVNAPAQYGSYFLLIHMKDGSTYTSRFVVVE